MKRAFTLIELLVVIAIIAILAAILFPVFAQAKEAAKKTQDLSGIKQTGTSCAIYLSDSDDTYPLGAGWYVGYGTLQGYYADAPADWEAANTAEDIEVYSSSWTNSIQPYMKSFDLLASPVAVKIYPGVYNYNNPRRKPAEDNFAYNGLLHAWSATAVASPSQMIAFSQSNGNMTQVGSVSLNPSLYNCNDTTGGPSCRFQPAPKQAGGTCLDNGGISFLTEPDQYLESKGVSNWVHGYGMIVGFADTSAKYRRLGSNVGGKTDYRTDPFTQYSSVGRAKYAWYDQNYCHPLQYMPDFDFQTYGAPYAGY